MNQQAVRSPMWVVLGLVAVLGACSTSTPEITSLSMTAVPEGFSGPVALTTFGCNPVFDLDRGTVSDDSMVIVRLDPGSRTLETHRTAVEKFETMLPNDLSA